MTALAAQGAIANDASKHGQKHHGQGASGSSDQDSTSTQSSSGSSLSQAHLYRASKLMDAKATGQNEEKLGEIEDLLVNPQTGKIDFAVLGRGGVLGIGEKLVPLPWKAINVTSENEVSVSVDSQKLKSGPTLSKDYSDLQNPSFAQSIYQYYSMSADVGGAELPGGSSQGSSSKSETESSPDKESSQDK